MGLKMHNELNSVEISKKMLEITAISFSPMNSSIPLKRKFKSPHHSHIHHLTSSAEATTDMSDKKRIKLVDYEEEMEHHHGIGSGTGGINLPSPPSSTRSSFDAITRDSFLSESGEASPGRDSLGGTLGESLENSDDPAMALEEVSDHGSEHHQNNKYEPDNLISLLTEDLIDRVINATEKELLKDVKIDPNGETILPSGLRIVKGVAEMEYYREDETNPPLRFTNQLNFLKMILNKYICRYKSALPFLNPVDSVRLKIPNYYLVIERPMDLNTVKNRLNSLWYQSASECISDIRQIFKNCYQFNSPTDYVYTAGKKLEEYFEAKLENMPPIEEEIPCPPRQNIEGVVKLDEKREEKASKSFAPVPLVPESSPSENHSGGANFTPIKMITRSERGVTVKKPNKDLPRPITAPQTKPASVKKVALNKPLRECCNFVKELFTKKHAEYAWPFWNPVDTHDYPDYLQKIKKPIDLSTIKTNIETGKYLTVNQFAKDMRLMFSNCLRYNAPDSPIIEQVRKLREVFEYRYAHFPEDYFTEKLVIPKDGGTPRQSAGGNGDSSSSNHATPESQKQQKKAKSQNGKGKSSGSKPRAATDPGDRGDGKKFNGNNKPDNDDSVKEERMKILEKQVEKLTTALTTVLFNKGSPETATTTLLSVIQSTVALTNGLPNGTPKAPLGKNGCKGKNKSLSKRGQKRKRRLSEESIDEVDEVQKEDDIDSYGNPGNRNGVAESFDPKSLGDLKKLKTDLENLHATDLQNVLRILQSTEPSLRCDEEQNLEIDFEALMPKTLIALRKYVTSCMLNNSKGSPSVAVARPSPATASTSSKQNKKICHQTSSSSNNSTVRAGGSTFDTDCDNSIKSNNGPPLSESRASNTNLQLSEDSSSDSETDDGQDK